MKPKSILRWIARLWGVASTLLLLAFTFGGHEHLHFTAVEAAVFLLFPVGVVLGFGVAWWRERFGGLITVGSLAVFYLVSGILGKPLSPYFLLFAAPGFLHLMLSGVSGPSLK